MYLPDINVWLALMFPAHKQHTAAEAWFDGSPTSRVCHFCRYTQMGFLRLANNPSAFPQVALTQDQAWKLYDLTIANPRVGFANEPHSLETILRRYSQSTRFCPNVWNDAYLAAFAVAGNYELVTFDQGFGQYPGLTVTIL